MIVIGKQIIRPSSAMPSEKLHNMNDYLLNSLKALKPCFRAFRLLGYVLFVQRCRVDALVREFLELSDYARTVLLEGYAEPT
jgi:hypothetical protein